MGRGLPDWRGGRNRKALSKVTQDQAVVLLVMLLVIYFLERK